MSLRILPMEPDAPRRKRTRLGPMERKRGIEHDAPLDPTPIVRGRLVAIVHIDTGALLFADPEKMSLFSGKGGDA